MKFTIALLLFLSASLHSNSQNLSFNEQIFTNPVITLIIKGQGVNTNQPYKLFQWTDSWQHNRFFYKPPGPNQHAEGMNLYVYNDTTISHLITPRQWSYFAHQALPQTTKKLKAHPGIILVKKNDVLSEGIYFSITQPVMDKKFALVDLTFYIKEKDDERSLPEQWTSGKSLIIFQKLSKNEWKLIRVVNRYFY